MNDHHPQPDLALAAWKAELAEQLGLAQSSVSQWERGGTQPSTPHLLRLLQMFPAAVAELIAGGTTSDMTTAEQGK